MEDLFICPCCKKQTTKPREEGWKEIEIGILKEWGHKFCPDCYPLYKDKDLKWEDLRKM